MKLPTFLIAGAPRAGTTFLYHVLDQHPDVYLAKPRAPEPKFFLIDDEYQKELDYYSQKYFAAARDQKAIGEKSTNYLESPAVPQRIARDLPGIKLVFILRNPIERAFSNYLWSKKNGFESLSFEEAIEFEAAREAQYPPVQRYSRPFSYLSRGFYDSLLQPYFDLFRPEQLKFLIAEELEASPRPILDDLCQFLGLEPLPESIDMPSRVNSARDGAERLNGPLRDRLFRLYEEPNRRLSHCLGRDLAEWVNICS
jgi:hypothetical protein